MPQPPVLAAPPPAVMLSPSQLATLAELGEERTADVGDVLYGVGDRSYPFIAILEGEVAILDAAGNEIVRHGAIGLPRRAEPALRADGVRHRGRHPAACATSPSTARCCARFCTRTGRSAISCCRRSSPGAKRSSGPGARPRDRRPALVQRHDADARVRAQQPAALHLARPRARRRSRGRGARRRTRRGEPAAGAAAGRRRAPWPVDRAGLSRARDRPRARAARGGRPARRRRRSRGPRRRRLRRVRGPRHAGHRQHGTRRPGRVRRGRIENYLGFPAGITRQRADQPRRHPGAEVRRARWRRPYRAVSLEPGDGRHIVRLEEDHEIAARAVAARHRRAVPPAAGRRPRPSTRGSASSTPPDRPRRSSAAPSASPSSAAGTRPARPRSGSLAAARS